MAINSLLNPDDPMFGWENQQAHAIAHDGPWIIDPDQSDNGLWRSIHQFAHDDMMQPPPPSFPQFGEAGGFPSAANFEDIDFSEDRARAFWTWTHQVEHQQAQPPTSA